jgi:hypothetical protein
MASAIPVTTAEVGAKLRQSHDIGTEPTEEILNNLEQANSKL